MARARQLFLLASIFALIALSSLSETALAEEEGEEEPRPLWMDWISLASGMFAMVCISYAVIDLGFKHRAFWIVTSFGALLDVIALFASGFYRASPAFWLAVSIGIGLIAMLIIYIVIIWAAGRVR